MGKASRIESLRLTEHSELGDVPPEEERRSPIGDDAQLSRQQRQLVEVVRPRNEPAGEAAEEKTGNLRDPFVASERRDLAEHAIPVWPRLAGDVLHEPACLAKRVLARRRVELAGSRQIRNACAVAECPHVRKSLDLQRRLNLD